MAASEWRTDERWHLCWPSLPSSSPFSSPSAYISVTAVTYPSHTSLSLGMGGAALFFSLLLLLSTHGSGHGELDRPIEPRPWPKKGLPVWPPPYNRPAAKGPAGCPHDAVKLVACAGLLSVGGISVGSEAGKKECCSLLGGLASAEVAACLCIVAKENILGIVTEWTVALAPLISACNAQVPSGFKCA